MNALKSAGLDWEAVFTSSSKAGLSGAVAAGLGVLAISRRWASGTGMIIADDTPLPKLPDLYRGVYIREGGARAVYQKLAGDIAEALSDLWAIAPKKLASFGTKQDGTSAA